MLFFRKTKDGGPKSTVEAYFAVEIKGLFSIALLKFNNGSRKNFHNHAFNAYTWFLKGDLKEECLGQIPITTYETTFKNGIKSKETMVQRIYETKYKFSIKPKYTPKALTHRVISNGTSWAFTIRGPWDDRWYEYDMLNDNWITLTHGRKEV